MNNNYTTTNYTTTIIDYNDHINWYYGSTTTNNTVYFNKQLQEKNNYLKQELDSKLCQGIFKGSLAPATFIQLKLSEVEYLDKLKEFFRKYYMLIADDDQNIIYLEKYNIILSAKILQYSDFGMGILELSVNKNTYYIFYKEQEEFKINIKTKLDDIFLIEVGRKAVKEFKVS